MSDQNAAALDGATRNMVVARDVLESRLTSTLELVNRNLRRIERYVEYWPDGGDMTGHLEDKIASESALLVMLARRIDPLPATIDRLTDELARLIVPIIRSERNQAVIMRNPQAAATLGLGHVYLSSAGYRNESWDRLVLGLLEDGYGDIKERYPHRLLDRRWARRLAGVSERCDETPVMKFSILRSRTHPFYMTAGDAYAYTHTMMYLSDFGRDSLRSAIDLPRVTEVINACLAWTLIEEDFDLLGEFLLSYVLLCQRWSAHADFAWQAMSSAWDSLGFLPGPTFDEETFLAKEGDARRAYAFQEMYHTNLVGGVVCAVQLTQNPAGLAEPAYSPVESRHLIARLESAIHEAARFCELSTDDASSANPEGNGAVNESEHDSLLLDSILHRCRRLGGRGQRAEATWAGVLESGAIPHQHARNVLLEGLTIAAVRNYDLAEIVRCVDDMIITGMESSVTFYETVLFVVRQQVESGAISAHFVDRQNLESPASRDVTRGLLSCLARAYGCLTQPRGHETKEVPAPP